jgi:excisionase family DNA binding protein
MPSSASSAPIDVGGTDLLTDYAGQELFTIADCQKILNVSRATCWRLVSAGQLQSVQIGGRRLVQRRSLLRLIEVGAEF